MGGALTLPPRSVSPPTYEICALSASFSYVGDSARGERAAPGGVLGVKGLARREPDDGDRSPCLTGALPRRGVGREDPFGQWPEPGLLARVIHGLRAKRPASERGPGMHAQVVRPGGVLRKAELRRDERHALTVMEGDDDVASHPPRARAARFQQRRGERRNQSEAPSAQAQEQRVDLPHDRPRDPPHRACPGDPGKGATDQAAACGGVDERQVGCRHRRRTRGGAAPAHRARTSGSSGPCINSAGATAGRLHPVAPTRCRIRVRPSAGLPSSTEVRRGRR